ncbi:hypothetical protein T06_3522, partial [Trichinella sp. T6]
LLVKMTRMIESLEREYSRRLGKQWPSKASSRRSFKLHVRKQSSNRANFENKQYLGLPMLLNHPFDDDAFNNFQGRAA